MRDPLFWLHHDVFVSALLPLSVYCRSAIAAAAAYASAAAADVTAVAAADDDDDDD